jgi:hypothetical protein
MDSIARHLLMSVFIGLMLVTGCANDVAAPTLTHTPAAVTQADSATTPQATETGLEEVMPGQAAVSVLVTIANAPTRTPAPTTAPSALTNEITSMFQQTGLSDERILGLSYADWINLIISLLFVLVGYLVASWLIRRLLPRLVSQTQTTLDDQLLEASGKQIRWLVVIVAAGLAIDRLTFIHPSFKALLNDIIFFLMLFFIVVILWRLIDLAADQANAKAARLEHADRVESLIRLFVWVARLCILLLTVTWVFGHFAIDIAGLAILQVSSASCFIWQVVMSLMM